MARPKRKQKKTTEFPGLLLLSCALLLGFSLISFVQGNPSHNWLGYIGYFFAWMVYYLFGFGGFVATFWLAWAGIQLLSKRNLSSISSKTAYFSLLLLSCCILLNVYSDSHPLQASSLGTRIYTETIYENYPSIHVRYNLGGVPIYYLYKDLPFFNLHQIIGPLGTNLIFSLMAIVSFLLLTEIRILANVKALLRLFLKMNELLIGKTPLLCQKIKSLCLGSLQNKKVIAPTNMDPINRLYKKKIAIPMPSAEIPIAPLAKKAEPLSQEKSMKIKEASLPKLTMHKAEKICEENPLPKKSSSYHLPPSSLLSSPSFTDQPMIKKELKKQAEILEETLKSFGIDAKVGNIHSGPTIVSFEVHPSIGVKVQKIKALENDIALNLQAKSIRILAPIPGKAAVGVEIPSLYPQEVSFKEMLLNYQQTKKSFAIPLLLGKTVTGELVIADLTRMPHCLIAGATGSGKSVCINSIVMSIVMNASPSEVKLMMVDPKKVELSQYTKLPHMIAPVITEAYGAYAALNWLVNEMHKRYEIFKQVGVRNIAGFNSRKINEVEEKALSIEVPKEMPLIVAIIDEFADLMMVSSSDLETPIARIAQMARAVGIHLILATQRPSREVITGIIKANFPCRIAFKVASRINSQIILDETGAESLLGNGDLLFLPPGSSHMVRAQGAFIRDEDINRTISHICERYPTEYLLPSFDQMPPPDPAEKEESFGRDKLYDQALQIVLSTKNASTTFLQRKLKIGYARAASLIDELEQNGIIGPQDGSKPRRILSSLFDAESNSL
jgi:S-DNA-T family DNA segregation ATPase FtsK/SpoIIIE